MDAEDLAVVIETHPEPDWLTFWLEPEKPPDNRDGDGSGPGLDLVTLAPLPERPGRPHSCACRAVVM